METNSRPIKSKKKLYVIIGLIITVFTITGGYLLYQQFYAAKNPLYTASQSAAFSIYNPTYLPKGYTLNADSLSITDNVVLVTANNESDKKIIITQQPTPAEFDFEQFYKQQYIGSRDVQSPYGRGKAGIIGDAVSGTLVTDSTWIIVTGSSDLPAKDIDQIIARLKPIQN